MDWKPWMDAFLPALLEAFPGRVAFMGIQGSYGRGEAGPDSDVDLLVDLSGADLSGFFAIGGLYNDLEAALQKEIDLITTVALEQPCRRMSDKLFREIVNKERRKIYAVA